MYGNRGPGARPGLLGQGFLGNTSIVMGSQMPGIGISPGGMHPGGMNPGGMNPGGMQFASRGIGSQSMGGVGGGGRMFPSKSLVGTSRLNMGGQQVLDMLPQRATHGGNRGMRRGGPNNRGAGRMSTSFSPPPKRSRPSPPPPRRTTDNGSSADKSDDRKTGKSRFKCQVCRLQFDTLDEFDSHMGSEGHAANMKVMSAVYHDKNQQLLDKNLMQGGATAAAGGGPSQQPRNDSGGPGGSMCKVCDKPFGRMSMHAHNQMPEHKRREQLAMKGCDVCNVDSFSNYRDYVTHLGSEQHQQQKLELRKSLELRSSSDKTQPDNGKSATGKPDARKSASEELSVEKPVAEKTWSGEESEQAEKTPEIVEVAVAEVDDDDGYMVDDTVYNPNVAVGVEHVISVTGYFCKLCHKFYNNESMARSTHCKSQAHFDKLMDHQQKSQAAAAVVPPSGRSSGQATRTGAKSHPVSSGRSK